MGKGSKPRPVSKNYGAEYERIYGKRCIRHRRANCAECFTAKELFDEDQTMPGWKIDD